MKKYNSFLGAFFSGDNGDGGYNAAYEKKSLANLYGGGLAPEQEQEALSGLSRVNPEAASKFQNDMVLKSAQLITTLGKDNPLAQQAWQTRIKPQLAKTFGAQAASLPDVIDDNIFAYAQQIAGGGSGKGKYTGAPIIVRGKDGKDYYARYSDNGIEQTDFQPSDTYTYNIDGTGNVWRGSRRAGEYGPAPLEGTKLPPEQPTAPTTPAAPNGNHEQNFRALSGKYGAQITSLTRTPEENRRVGGVDNSYHLTSQAGDFVVPQQAKAQFMADAKAMGYEAIDEGDHIHLEPLGSPAPRTAAMSQQGPQQAKVGVKPPGPPSAPSGYQYNAAGTLEPIKGGPADPANKEKTVGLGDVNTLRDDYTKAIQQPMAVMNAYEKMRQAAEDPSPAGDIALIYAYMKILDPTSVVRETEFATAENAGSVPDSIRNQWNRAISGQRVAINRGDFINQGAKLYIGAKQQYNQVRQQFGGIVQRNGINPADVLVDSHVPISQKFPAKGQVYKPQTDADFAKIPKGGLYIDPDDGKQYRKK